MMAYQTASLRMRRRLYEMLEASPHETRAGMLATWFIAGLVIVSLCGTVLESVPHLKSRYGGLFHAIEIISLVVFSIEYAIRIWIAPEHVPYRQLSGHTVRRNYILSGQGIVDFLAIVPLWGAMLESADLRVLIVLRILRVMKFGRYSSGMSSLLDVLWSERRALLGCLVILICATLVSASVMHVIEGTIQPDKFGTIPDAMWWSLVTLTTIGYGDVVPATAIGKMVAAVIIVAGVVMIALPVGIVANAFSDVIHRRDFIITWSMVARVPIFSHLTAGDIAHVMQLLRARQVEKGQVIARRGDVAHAMYFVTEGEVEIDLRPGHSVKLGAGQFFGERALLRKTSRSATVIACTRSRLLVLDASDLRSLVSRDPHISEHIDKIASGRTDHEDEVPNT
ncbi:MAG: cyclic nucleotide-gated ion channel [Afipia sp.]|nr:cyclic nucleotide-gated ion channel [Afipia sp.]